jgi:hypothetical protein
MSQRASAIIAASPPESAASSSREELLRTTRLCMPCVAALLCMCVLALQLHLVRTRSSALRTTQLSSLTWHPTPEIIGHRL